MNLFEAGLAARLSSPSCPNKPQTLNPKKASKPPEASVARVVGLLGQPAGGDRAVGTKELVELLP